MLKIFISYRREDSMEVAGRIHDRMSSVFGNDNVIKDVDTFPIGVDFRRSIQVSIDQCDVVIVVVGDRWLETNESTGKRRIDSKNDLVRLEIERALERGILVVPVLVRGATMPTEEQLPGRLSKLSYRNAAVVRVDPDFHRDMDRVIEALQDHDKTRAHKPPRVKLPPAKPDQQPATVERPPARTTPNKPSVVHPKSAAIVPAERVSAAEPPISRAVRQRAEPHQKKPKSPEDRREKAVSVSPPKPISSRWVVTLVLASVVSLAVLIALAIPAIQAMRESSRRSVCDKNLKQLAQAMNTYLDTHDTLPPPMTTDEDGKPMHSWRVLLLPMLGQDALYQEYDFNEPWDGPNNRKLASRMPDVFKCPSDDSPNATATNYMVVTSLKEWDRQNQRQRTAFYFDEQDGWKGAHSAEIADGSSNTILLVEVTGSTTNWMEPKDLDIETVNLTINSTDHDNCVSSRHTSGVNVAFADGTTCFVPDTYSPDLFRSLLTMADGETVPRPDDD